MSVLTPSLTSASVAVFFHKLISAREATDHLSSYASFSTQVRAASLFVGATFLWPLCVRHSVAAMNLKEFLLLVKPTGDVY